MTRGIEIWGSARFVGSEAVHLDLNLSDEVPREYLANFVLGLRRFADRVEQSLDDTKIDGIDHVLPQGGAR